MAGQAYSDVQNPSCHSRRGEYLRGLQNSYPLRSPQGEYHSPSIESSNAWRMLFCPKNSDQRSAQIVAPHFRDWQSGQLFVPLSSRGVLPKP